MAGTGRLVSVRRRDDTPELVGEVAGCLGLTIGLLALGIYFSLVNGWVLTILWGWFVLALFKGAPTLGLPVAIGLMLIVRMLTYIDTGDLQTKERELGMRIARKVGQMLSPFAMLLFGWIVHRFV